MFLLRCIRRLCALPFWWIGRLAGAFNQPLSVPLLKMAWWIGGDGQAAVAALAVIQRCFGAKAAIVQAARWLTDSPRAEIAAYAGLLAVNLHDFEQARGFFQCGRSLPPDREGLIELLEFSLANQDGDPATVTEVARRFDLRHDLSPALRKCVLEQLLWDAMFCGRMDEAGQRAEHLWSIEDNPLAAIAFWSLAKQRGIETRAAGYFSRLKLKESENLYYRILGFLTVGMFDEVRRLLPRLEQLNASLAGTLARILQRKEAAP